MNIFLFCSPRCPLQNKKKIFEIGLVDREIIVKKLYFRIMSRFEMNDVQFAVKDKYRLDLHSEWLIEPLAKAIFGLLVNKMDKIKVNDKWLSYQDLSSMGI